MIFEVASCKQLDLQSDAPNLRFCCQAQYFGGFAGRATSPTIGQIRCKIAVTMVHARAVRDNSRVCRSRTRLCIDCGRLGVSPGAPGRSFWRCGSPLWTLRALPPRAAGVLRRSLGVPKTLIERPWATPGVSRGSRDRFCIDFACPGATPGSILDQFSRRLSHRFRERAGQRGSPGRSTCYRSGWLDLPWLSSTRNALVTTPWPCRPGHNTLAATPGRNALATTPWPHSPGRNALAWKDALTGSPWQPRSS